MAETQDQPEDQPKVHPVLKFLSTKKEKITAAVPKTFQAALTWESVMQGVALQLEDPERGPKLAECRPQTIYNALLTILRLALDPSPVLQQAFLIPRGNACTPQIGVQGFIELAMRSERVTKIVAQAVYAADDIEVDLAEGYIKHTVSKAQLASEEDPGPPIAAYARVWLKGVETPKLELLRRWDIMKIRRIAAKGGNTPAWRNWEERMAVRSALSRVLKHCPKSTELMQALNSGLHIEEHDRKASFEVDVIDAEPAPKVQGKQLPDYSDSDEVVERDLDLLKSKGRPDVVDADANPPFAGGEEMP